MADPAPAAGERIGVVFIHGVGETEPGWINQYVVDRLVANGATLSFDSHSEVYPLRDRGSSKPTKTFTVFARRCHDDAGRNIALLELFWSDLSRIGQSAAASTLAAVRLFYEAPRVIGSASLRGTNFGLSGLVGQLTLAANWLVRWPISGTNAAALTCAAVLLVLVQVARFGPATAWLQDLDLFWPIGATLVVLTFLGLVIGKYNAHRDIALADLSFSTSLFSAVFLGLLIWSRVQFGAYGIGLSDGPIVYLWAASNIIMPLWIVWTLFIVLAILLFGFLGLLRGLRLASPRLAPLSRPGAALGLSTIQGMIWKIVMAFLWVLMMGVLVTQAITDPNGCSTDMAEHCRSLNRLNLRLGVVTVVNLTMAFTLVLIFMLLVQIRSLMHRAFAPSLIDLKRQLPRLIVSEWIVAAMFLFTLFNAYNFYGVRVVDYTNEFFKTSYALPYSLYDWLEGKGFQEIVRYMAGGAGLAALLAYLRILGSVRDASRGVLHIARDLVDHHYAATSMISRSLSGSARTEPETYPRRERIQKRMRELMASIANTEHFDRVIFVSHSQGTVILHDYLSSPQAAEDLSYAHRIDVVTLASPLTHLYKHYFPAYDGVPGPTEGLTGKLASWTNMWRIDDPIGNRVDIARSGLVTNKTLPAGGHVDYWREKAVCEAILDLIGRTGQTAPRPSAATPPTEPKPVAMWTGTGPAPLGLLQMAPTTLAETGPMT